MIKKHCKISPHKEHINCTDKKNNLIQAFINREKLLYRKLLRIFTVAKNCDLDQNAGMGREMS